LCPPILVDSRAMDDCTNSISVSQSGIERLEDESTSTFTACEAGNTPVIESKCLALIIQ